MKSEKQKAHLVFLAKSRVGKKHTDETKRKISEKRKILIGAAASNWKGGRILVSGYWYVYSPEHPNRTKDKYVTEHRLVVEKKIGRFLEKSEVVHHVNGDKTDNRIENLVICQSSGKHSSEHHIKRSVVSGRFEKL